MGNNIEKVLRAFLTNTNAWVPNYGAIDGVLSLYETVIAVREQNGHVILNATGYSQTTTRLQNLLRARLPQFTSVIGLPRGATRQDLIEPLGTTKQLLKPKVPVVF